MIKKFEVKPSGRNEAASEILSYVRERLKEFRMKQNEENRITLMFEESMMSLMDNMNSETTQTVRVSFKRFLDTMSIELSVPGEEFSFADTMKGFEGLNLDDADDDTKGVIQNIILRSFGDRLKYIHKKGINYIKIEAVRSPYTFLYKTLTAIFTAVILGVLCRYFVPESTYMTLNDNLLVPVRTIFMNSLKIVVAPLVFFAVVNSVSQFRNLSELGKIGGQIMTRFMIMELLACVFAGLLFGASEYTGIRFSQIIPYSGAISEVSDKILPVRQVIVNIIPTSFAAPFISADMLQLIFLGIICGIAVGSIGDYSKSLRDSFNAWDQMFRKIASMLTRFVPLAVLCSIWSVILTIGTKLLLSLVAIIIIAFTGLFILMCIDCVRLKLTGLSVSTFVRKYAPAMAHLISTTSGTLSIPKNMEASASLGVPQKIYSLSIPLGVVFSKNGTIFYRALVSLFITQLYVIDVSTSALISVLFSSFVLALTTTGVPGGAYIAFPAMLSQLGVPAEAIAYVIAIDAVLDIFIAVINSFEDVVSSIIVSHKAGILDIDTYNRLE